MYFDPEDSEMRKFIHLARSVDPHFHIIPKLSVALLARQVYPDAPLQLVIPYSHGICYLLLKNLHTSVTGAQIGARKLNYFIFTHI